MPALAPFTVTRTAQNITGLVNGKTYTIQYPFKSRDGVGYIQYCNHASDPTGESVSWFTLRPGDFITTGVYNTADPLWVRVPKYHEDADDAFTARISVAEA